MAVVATIVLSLISATPVLSRIQCSDPRYNWTFNSAGLSPCEVSVQLFQSCGKNLTLDPITTPQETYLFSDFAESHKCWCNTVFYSLISACAACQGGKCLPWSNFSTNCPQTYPSPSPSGLNIPQWAFDASTNETCNRVNLSSGSSSITLPTPTGDVTRPTASNSGPPTTTRAITVEIIGGVIGGIVAVILIAGLFIWNRRRKHIRCTKSTPYPFAYPPRKAPPVRPVSQDRELGTYLLDITRVDFPLSFDLDGTATPSSLPQ